MAIILWGVLTAIGLFAFAVWQGSPLGALSAIGLSASVWAFQHVDYSMGADSAPGLVLFVVAVTCGATSAFLSFFGV